MRFELANLKTNFKSDNMSMCRNIINKFAGICLIVFGLLSWIIYYFIILPFYLMAVFIILVLLCEEPVLDILDTDVCVISLCIFIVVLFGFIVNMISFKHGIKLIIARKPDKKEIILFSKYVILSILLSLMFALGLVMFGITI